MENLLKVNPNRRNYLTNSARLLNHINFNAVFHQDFQTSYCKLFKSGIFQLRDGCMHFVLDRMQFGVWQTACILGCGRQCAFWDVVDSEHFGMWQTASILGCGRQYVDYSALCLQIILYINTTEVVLRAAVQQLWNDKITDKAPEISHTWLTARLSFSKLIFFF